ncbi:MAG: citrate (Si)-synthase, partial [candidate division Zixibacteria bacterium]|nr:citrate (Si)-synthase [candidate division Zixibacteria bacterium]
MSALKSRLEKMLPSLREEVKSTVTYFGDEKLSEVTVAQAFGGMRGVTAVICDTSEVDPQSGLVIRGRPILELTDRLPEEIFWLLLAGDLPSESELESLQSDLRERAKVPDYVFKLLKVLPKDSHPMAMLNACILAMERESIFRKRYFEGMAKTDYWAAALEDGLNLIAAIPEVAAAIYRIRYEKGEPLPSKPELGWGANYAQMMGLDVDQDEFAKFMNLYLTLHSDHEGGNVSAFACYTVASALSDPYYSVCAGLNGLAGPLHGLAN